MEFNDVFVPQLAFLSGLLSFLLAAMAIFLILLVLVQRGRGGGLAGALGGMGGSSAFGAKAGDVFTKITAWSALAWIVLCIMAAKYGSSGGKSLFDVKADAAESGESIGSLDSGDKAEADKGATAESSAGDGEEEGAAEPKAEAPAEEPASK